MCTFNYKQLELPISGGWPIIAALLGTQFTGFAGTQVQILTQKAVLCSSCHQAAAAGRAHILQQPAARWYSVCLLY
jgi:hypothetical protein